MGYFILKNFDKIFFRKFLAPRSTETNGAHFTSAEITRYGQKSQKQWFFWLFAVFSTLGNDCEGDFELTFDFLPEDLPKHKRLTTFDAQQTCFWPFLRLFKGPPRKQWHIYTRKICKKDDFLNFSAFWTLGNDCEGDFGLAFDFHTEDLVEYKRKTASDAW